MYRIQNVLDREDLFCQLCSGVREGKEWGPGGRGAGEGGGGAGAGQGRSRQGTPATVMEGRLWARKCFMDGSEQYIEHTVTCRRFKGTVSKRRTKS